MSEIKLTKEFEDSIEDLKLEYTELEIDNHNLKRKLEKIEKWGYIALDYLDKMELEDLTKEFKEILEKK